MIQFQNYIKSLHIIYIYIYIYLPIVELTSNLPIIVDQIEIQRVPNILDGAYSSWPLQPHCHHICCALPSLMISCPRLVQPRNLHCLLCHLVCCCCWYQFCVPIAYPKKVLGSQRKCIEMSNIWVYYILILRGKYKKNNDNQQYKKRIIMRPIKQVIQRTKHADDVAVHLVASWLGSALIHDPPCKIGPGVVPENDLQYLS